MCLLLITRYKGILLKLRIVKLQPLDINIQSLVRGALLGNIFAPSVRLNLSKKFIFA